MTKDEFVQKVVTIIESGKMDELDDLYFEVLGLQPKEDDCLGGEDEISC